jgi:linoleoyl-CoA desaturase
MRNLKLKFSNELNPDFINDLRQKVKDYFETNHISRNANAGMVIKTIVMLSLYLLPYFVMISGLVTSGPAIFLLWIIMGFGMAGVGLSIMHDAAHRSYSKKQWINTMLAHSLNILGGSVITWQYQHNILHHGYTNIDGYDEDIDPGIIMRFSPTKPRYFMHRFQHIYAWVLYGLMSLMWSINKDFKQLRRYHKEGAVLSSNKSYPRMIFNLIISKLVFYGIILVIPLIVLPIPWWMVVIGYLSMQFVCGLILAVIFQTAHVVPETNYFIPNEEGNIENNWAIHQLMTTSDYAPKSKLFSWYVGGLNYQVEHHLFPNICHVHYKKIANLVRETAHEYKLPYNVKPTFLSAIIDHGRMLKILGQKMSTV